MDHHFYHQHQQKNQPHVENVTIKKRPNTAIVMKQFYKPGDRPKSSLQQHKLLEWKCECGEQLYVNKVMNLNISSSVVTKGFPGRKIGLYTSNLVKRMKGNDEESKMKFKEMSLGSRMSPYDILMEKYSQLKQQEDQQINMMNYANNPYEQLYNLNYNTTNNNLYQNTNTNPATQTYEQPNYLPTNQEYNQNNNYTNMAEVHNNIQNYNPPQQSSFYQAIDSQLNQLKIHNLIPQEENNYHQERIEENQQNSSNQDNIHFFQREHSQKQVEEEQEEENEGIDNEYHLEREHLQNDESEQQVQQNISEYNTSENQIQYEGDQMAQQEDNNQQFYQQEEYQQEHLEGEELGQIQEQENKEIVQLEGSDTNRMEQYMQYQQILLEQKQQPADQSIEEYPEPNRFDQHEEVNQFEIDEQRVLQNYQQQQQEQQQKYQQMISQQQEQQQQQFQTQNSQNQNIIPTSNQNHNNQRFFSAVTRKTQPQSQKAYQRDDNLHQQQLQPNQIHEGNYSIDNVSILSAKKPKRPQTSNLARPLNLNLDMKKVLPLKRVGSASNNPVEPPISSQVASKFHNKYVNSLPASAKSQTFQLQGLYDDPFQSEYIHNNAFHRPSSMIKNSSFYSLQQRKKSATGLIPQSAQGQGSTKMTGSVKNLFQQPLINDLGKQVNIRSVKQLHQPNQLGLSQTYTGPFRENISNHQNTNTQTDDRYDQRSSNLFITNPTHYPFKVKNLISSTVNTTQFPSFNQTSRNALQRPFTSNPYKRV